MRRFGLILLLLVGVVCGQMPSALADAPPDAHADAPPGPAMPILPLLHGNHALYVLAVGSDYSSRSKLIAALAERLEEFKVKNDPWIFAEPGWTVADYANQCTQNPGTTEGAILLGIAASASGSANEFFYSRNWLELDADALYISCESNLALPTVAAKPIIGIAWDSGLLVGKHTKKTYGQLFGAAALVFAAASTVSSFIPSHQASSLSTMAFPTTNPVPPGGQVVEKTEGWQTLSNPSSLSNSSVALLTPALAFANPGTTAPAPLAEEMTWNAAEIIVTGIVDRMNCPVAPGRKLSEPLSAENRGRTPAPFCGQQPTTP